MIGAFVRGLSMRDVESLCEEAGLGKTSQLDGGDDLLRAARALPGVLSPLALRRQVGRAVPRRDLPAGPPKRPEGRCDLRLGNRREWPQAAGFRAPRGAGVQEDWVELGRDLIARGLAAPRLVVADGAPGLTSAVEEIWPRADRQHCAVHRLQPAGEAAQVRAGPDPLQLLVSAHRRDLAQGRQAPPPGPDLRARASRLPGRRPLPLRRPRRAHRASALPAQAPRTVALNESPRAVARGGPPAHQGDGPHPRRDQLPHPRLSRPRPVHRARLNGATFTELDRQHLYRIKYQQADSDTLDDEVGSLAAS